MKLNVKHTLPLYRKLLLENKILLLFAVLLLVLLAGGLGASYWASSHAARGMLFEQLAVGLEPLLDSLADSAATVDKERLELLLEQSAEKVEEAAYLIVVDPEGRPLAYVASAGVTSSVWEPRPIETAAETAAHRTDTKEFIEWTVPLHAHGRQVGSLTAGVEPGQISRFATRVMGMTGALMAVPALLLFLVARGAVRHSVKGMKELIRVADEISTGKLDPRIDLGLRVNCWEIKDCGRTDCKAYMNIRQQCWYIDDTPCEGYEPRFPQKLQRCRQCEVYQLHRGDEIVQLAGAFKHMTAVLRSSRDELVKSGEFQKRLIDQSFDGIVATDADDVITIFNQLAEDLIGVSAAEVIGKRDWRAFFRDGLENRMDLPLSHERFHRARGIEAEETEIRRADGVLVDVLLSAISLYEGGQHIGKVFFFQDKREIKRLRENLIQSERLAATGQAAAEISHSIKNILDGFAGGAYVFKHGRKNDNPGKMDMGWDMIERNMKIISDLVNDLLNFARERSPDYAVVDPASLIEDVLANMGSNEDDGVTVRVTIDDPSARVVLDSHAFHQCMTNLVRNAKEAIPPGRNGTVTVSVEIERDTAIFSVSDDGVGMSPETVEKVRGGMYSTKGSKGTGLGLQVIQKVVSEHRGTLTIESEEGQGSTFRIVLPRDGTQAAA